jgi:hypothetical protein
VNQKSCLRFSFFIVRLPLFTVALGEVLRFGAMKPKSIIDTLFYLYHIKDMYNYPKMQRSAAELKGETSIIPSHRSNHFTFYSDSSMIYFSQRNGMSYLLQLRTHRGKHNEYTIIPFISEFPKITIFHFTE